MTEESRDDQMKDDTSPLEGSGGLWASYGGKVMLGLLGAYLALLLIGVIAEVFNLQGILDWWLWRPPGKPPG